jgi:thiol-disulfide isomerase/thioredoxin
MDPQGNLSNKVYNPESKKTTYEKFKDNGVIIVEGIDNGQGTSIESVKKGKAGLLMIWRDGCPHCETAKPEFMQFGFEIAKKIAANPNYGFVVMAMDSTKRQNEKFMDDNDVAGVPTFIMYAKDGTSAKYNGERKAQSFWGAANKLISL